jgi:hypothetical protein
VHRVGDAAETPKAVADDRAGRVETALGKAGDRRCTEADDPRWWRFVRKVRTPSYTVMTTTNTMIA